MEEIQIVSKDEAEEFRRSLMGTPSTAVAMLLVGDRWSCVDEVVLARTCGEIIGIGTIASRGEEGSGEPTIVALYMLPEHRRSGVASMIFEAAIDRMVSQGLTPIRVDAIHSGIISLARKLPEEKQRMLNIVDLSAGGIFDVMLEM